MNTDTLIPAELPHRPDRRAATVRFNPDAYVVVHDALDANQDPWPKLREVCADAGRMASPFAQRIETLDILASTTKNNQLLALPVGKLKSLNADRNHLAHGHFDQNPFDRSYSLVLAARTRDYPVSRILALSAELAQIADQFRHAEILYDFDDLTDAGANHSIEPTAVNCQWHLASHHLPCTPTVKVIPSFSA